ncbi:hypothetical protein BGW80DRAFT_1343118 [Lactifluus volemus]|nr:hypothetical protein BGW80DRAFT_1343118 [Lactifluus volemus]
MAMMAMCEQAPIGSFLPMLATMTLHVTAPPIHGTGYEMPYGKAIGRAIYLRRVWYNVRSFCLPSRAGVGGASSGAVPSF